MPSDSVTMTRPVSRSVIQNHKIRVEGVGNPSGQGNAIRRHGKIKVAARGGSVAYPALRRQPDKFPDLGSASRTLSIKAE